MKTTLIATTIAAFLGMAALGALSAGAHAPWADNSEPGADEHAMEHGMAGDPHGQTGMKRPAFPPAVGSVPTSGTAQSLPQVDSIGIFNDTQFNPSNGVKVGEGTLEDPYVIEGLYVTGDLYLGDTDACIVIRENWIAGQLTLNWNNQCVHVHHNHIQDLRVNENNERTGMPTGGLIELNEIVIVGQIRHYDGEFRHNTIGPATADDLISKVLHESPLPFADVTDPVVLNIDGWNQALFHHNTIYGSVSLDLHGHHHGTGFLSSHSHYHGDDMDRVTHEEDHTQRWTSVSFTDNKVVDPEGYGIRYDDQAHAGDDRTANSESVEMLEEDHRHWVQVDISRNDVSGAGIWVDVFGADDELHTAKNPGSLSIRDNKVSIQQRDPELLGTPFFATGWDANQAIRVVASKEVTYLITGNTMSFTASDKEHPLQPVYDALFPYETEEFAPVAIELYDVRDANITLSGNSATGFAYGIRAREMDSMTWWTVTDNDFQAPNPVWYDDSVANRPGDQAASNATEEPAEDPHAGHGHGDPSPAPSPSPPPSAPAMTGLKLR